MAKVRVSPTILTNGISIVKGTEFNNERTVGSFTAAVNLFAMRDVDELTILDVNASREKRHIDVNLVKLAADSVNIPLCVGGGVNDLFTFEKLLRAGADKIVVGFGAIERPELIKKLSQRFGSQAVVLSIDAKTENSLEAATLSGTLPVLNKNIIDLAREGSEAGAGEILLQTISLEGTMRGMNNNLIEQVSSAVPIPIIAGSGASNYEDIYQAICSGASSVSAGAIFQFTEHTPKGAREYLKSRGMETRISY